LILKTAHYPLNKQYQFNHETKALNINTIIQIFYINVTKVDQDSRYIEYKKKSSFYRIFVITTSLSLGINIPDIRVIII